MANKRDVTVKHRRTAVQPAARLEYTEEPDSAGELEAVRGRRKRRKRHILLRVFARLLVVAVLVGGGIVVWKNWDSLAPESLVVWLDEKMGGTKSGSFPVDITGSSVLNMTQTEDGLALLTDTSYVLYNSNGGELVRRQHGFSSPILKTAGKWSLIAEEGGSRVRVETRAATAVELTVDTHIVEGAMGNNGDFALATDSSQGYTSEVVVYNKHKDEIYHWYSSELTVTDAALSPDGKSLAVVGVTADAGSMTSSILIFDFDKKNPVAEYHDSNLLLCAVGYFPNGTLAAVGDQALWVVNKNGSIQQKQNYDGHDLVGFTIGDNAVSVALRNYGSSDKGTLMSVNPAGDKAYSTDYEGSFRSIASYNSGILLLTSEHLYRVNTAGKPAMADVVRDGRLVSALSNKAVILGLTQLTECDIPSA